jgi:hypothetical protein
MAGHHHEMGNKPGTEPRTAPSHPNILSHPDLDEILALGWAEYQRARYYYAGKQFGWLRYDKPSRSARNPTVQATD